MPRRSSIVRDWQIGNRWCPGLQQMILPSRKVSSMCRMCQTCTPRIWGCNSARRNRRGFKAANGTSFQFLVISRIRILSIHLQTPSTFRPSSSRLRRGYSCPIQCMRSRPYLKIIIHPNICRTTKHARNWRTKDK